MTTIKIMNRCLDWFSIAGRIHILEQAVAQSTVQLWATWVRTYLDVEVLWVQPEGKHGADTGHAGEKKSFCQLGTFWCRPGSAGGGGIGQWGICITRWTAKLDKQ